MRIAFFADSYLPARDGVTTAVINFKWALENEGHKVFIFAPKPPKGSNIKSKFRPLRVPSQKEVFYYPSVPLPTYPSYKIVVNPLPPLLKLRSLKVDVIHGHGAALLSFIGLEASKILNVPYAVTYHTYFPKALHYIPFLGSRFGKVTSKIVWDYTKLILNEAELPIAPSAFIKKELEKHGVRGVKVVPNGIDLARFSNLDPKWFRRKFGINDDEEVVMYLGRLAKEKNLPLLISAFSEIQKEGESEKIRLVIAGTGPEEENLKKLAKRLKVDVVFTGFVPEQDLPNYYAGCDVFCFPSSFETQGLVALEAMAAGKGVVAMNSPALAEIINTTNGELFKTKEELIQKILKAVKRKESYKQGALATAKKYSIQNVTKQLIKEYENITS